MHTCFLCTLKINQLIVFIYTQTKHLIDGMQCHYAHMQDIVSFIFINGTDKANKIQKYIRMQK